MVLTFSGNIHGYVNVKSGTFWKLSLEDKWSYRCEYESNYHRDVFKAMSVDKEEEKKRKSLIFQIKKSGRRGSRQGD